ncbi:hypothetical protein ACYJ1Y_11325 [Natrialbaceae archaeon A-gly3]
MYDTDTVTTHRRRLSNVPTASDLEYEDSDVHVDELFDAVEFRRTAGDRSREEWLLVDSRTFVHDVTQHR